MRTELGQMHNRIYSVTGFQVRKISMVVLFEAMANIFRSLAVAAEPSFEVQMKV